MKYFIIAGEASGDMHASNLMKEIKIYDIHADFCFLGGDLMQSQGGEMVMHYKQMAFMGFWNVLVNIAKVLNNIKLCKQAILDFQPDVVILIDYPGFNLRIARFVKEKLSVPVYYYIAPKIWAWKESRIKQIKKYVDKVFSIIPFEKSFYSKHHYPVDYVGNPSVDSVFNRPLKNQSFQEFISSNRLIDKPIIALLSGSRKQEIKTCLPRMIAGTLAFTDYQLIIAGAPGIDEAFYEPYIKNSSVKIVFGQTYQLMQHASAAVINSGTATLEAALIGLPQVVVYHITLVKYIYPYRSLFFKIKWFSLVNLIAENEVVKELIEVFTQESVREEMHKLLYDKEYHQQILNNYDLIRNKIGEPGAANRAASLMIKYLKLS
jgi:lipid-A-disaccharide synthase